MTSLSEPQRRALAARLAAAEGALLVFAAYARLAEQRAGGGRCGDGAGGVGCRVLRGL